MSAACCKICGEETHYRCLSCTKPICNHSNNCSIAAPVETTGWKAGSLVSFCVSCTQTAETATSHYQVALEKQRSQGKIVTLEPPLVSIYIRSVNVLTFHRNLLFSSMRKNTQILEAGSLLHRRP